MMSMPTGVRIDREASVRSSHGLAPGSPRARKEPPPFPARVLSAVSARRESTFTGPLRRQPSVHRLPFEVVLTVDGEAHWEPPVIDGQSSMSAAE